LTILTAKSLLIKISKNP